MKKKHNSALRSSALQITFISLSAALLTLAAAPAAMATPCVETAGYWANHPNAWCIQNIQLGTQVYTQDQAIAIIRNSTSGDKTYSLAAQLIAAKLNTLCAGADSSCAASAMSNADTWLAQYPVGSNVPAKSAAWKQISPSNDTLSLYNQGHLCVPECRS